MINNVTAGCDLPVSSPLWLRQCHQGGSRGPVALQVSGVGLQVFASWNYNSNHHSPLSLPLSSSYQSDSRSCWSQGRSRRDGSVLVWVRLAAGDSTKPEDSSWSSPAFSGQLQIPLLAKTASTSPHLSECPGINAMINSCNLFRADQSRHSFVFYRTSKQSLTREFNTGHESYCKYYLVPIEETENCQVKISSELYYSGSPQSWSQKKCLNSHNIINVDLRVTTVVSWRRNWQG